MLSHVTLGCDDFDAALVFWTPVMAALGWHLRFVDRARPWAGWEPARDARPLFIITVPRNGAPAMPGNGTMTAFDTASRATVDSAHALALSLGGTCEGPPGLRPAYHPNYYGAYFRDPAGNKVGLACHRSDTA